MNKFVSILTTNEYKIKNNIISFIQEDERPYWSIQIDEFYKDRKYPMGHMYNTAKLKNINDLVMQKYYNAVSSTDGIIIDLASGVSGYFGPILDRIDLDSEFVITDASKEMIKVHATANKKRKNVVVCEIDLDKKLPFRDNSVDMYCGNLISNVNKYKELIQEVARTLKKNGKFIVIEWFFEINSKTQCYLKENNSLIQSMEYYIDYCSQCGLKLVSKGIQSKSVGKQVGDLLPINPNDEKSVVVLYFEKMIN